MAETTNIFCIITNTGKELQARAHKYGVQVVIDKISVGDGGSDTAPVPTPYGIETALANEVWRGDISEKTIDSLNPNILWLRIVIPATEGDFWIREYGVWAQNINDDGTVDPDTRVLFAYGNHAEYYKTKPISGQTVTHDLSIPIVVSETADVKIEVPESGYASKSEMDETKAVVETHTTSIEELNTVVANILPSTWFHRDELPVATDMGLGIQIYPTSVNIGGNLYKNVIESVLTLDDNNSWDNSNYATAANRAGKDVFIYACQPASGTEPVYKLSVNSTVPSGYTADTSRKIGGFHCLCLAVGTIAGHTLNNWATGSILPLTAWDLRFHSAATCGNEGQFFFNGNWVGIYLPGWNGSRLVNQYGAQIADGEWGTNPANGSGFSGESFVEYAGYIGMHLISRDMFMQIAEGSNQRTNIVNSADPGTSGGHYDTAGRRMISNYGAEDCCGVLWQWTSDTCDSGALWYDSLNGNAQLTTGTDIFYTNTKYVQEHSGRPYNWREESVWEDVRTTLNTVPASYSSNGRGSCYSGLLRRWLVGAYWGHGSSCGSRSVHCAGLSSNRPGFIGSRLVSETMGD